MSLLCCPNMCSAALSQILVHLYAESGQGSCPWTVLEFMLEDGQSFLRKDHTLPSISLLLRCESANVCSTAVKAFFGLNWQ